MPPHADRVRGVSEKKAVNGPGRWNGATQHKASQNRESRCCISSLPLKCKRDVHHRKSKGIVVADTLDRTGFSNAGIAARMHHPHCDVSQCTSVKNKDESAPRRDAVCNNFEPARTRFDVGRYIEVSGAHAIGCHRHAAVVVRAGIEDMSG